MQAQTPHSNSITEPYSPLHPEASPRSSSSVLTPGSVSPRRAKRRSPAPVLARWNFEVDGTAEGSPNTPSPLSFRNVTPSKLPIPRIREVAKTEDLAKQIQELNLADHTAADSASAAAQDSFPSLPHNQRRYPIAGNPVVETQASSLTASSTLEVSKSITKAFDDVAEVRSQIFKLEEERHSGAILPDGKVEMAVIQIDALLEGISRIVQELEAALARDTTTREACSVLDDQKDSFDELASEWMAVQSEVDTLKKELSDTKYFEHFQAFGRQVTDIMDSLERAVVECNDFVASFKRQGLAATKGADANDDDDDDEDDEMRRIRRLRQFGAASKSFKTKASYYVAPCEQTFTSFERSLKDRGTSHGTVLRQLGDLKQRWKGLKERSARVETDLRKLERTLANAEQPESAESIASAGTKVSSGALPGTMRSPLLPINSAKRPQLPAGGKSTTSPSIIGATILRSPLPADSSLPSTPLKTTSAPQRASSFGLTPGSPADRFPGQAPDSGGLTGGTAGSGLLLVPGSISRIPSTPSRAYRLPSSSSQVDTDEGHAPKPLGDGAITSRTAVKRLSAGPEVLRNNGSVSRRRLSGVGVAPSTPSQAPSSYRFASGDLGTPADRSIAQRSQISQAGTPARRARPEEEESEILASRPASRASMTQQTTSTPAATTGKPAVRRMSRIPTLTPRPSSAMSASRPPPLPTSTPKTPSINRLRDASRSTMQTPEPVIAARVKNLSVYSRPSTGGLSTSSMGKSDREIVGAATPRKKSLAGPASRPPVTRSSVPPVPSLRTNGRTTPLSASALAKIPHATPMSLSTSGASTGERSTSLTSPPSVAGSSVANFRASRASIMGGGGLLGTPSSKRSGRDGSATPTFSEGGYSAFSHGAAGGFFAPSSVGGRTSRAGSLAPTSGFPYRPNANDALDVAISRITNSHGIYLTREDPPLPRGHKLETGPGKDIRARYRFGNQAAVMTCKLLELHKPARASAVVTAQMEEDGIDATGVQRKVLVKVPSRGFLDLKVWLSSSFAQQISHDHDDQEVVMDGQGEEADLSIVSRGGAWGGRADESLGETF